MGGATAVGGGRFIIIQFYSDFERGIRSGPFIREFEIDSDYTSSPINRLGLKPNKIYFILSFRLSFYYYSIIVE